MRKLNNLELEAVSGAIQSAPRPAPVIPTTILGFVSAGGTGAFWRSSCGPSRSAPRSNSKETIHAKPDQQRIANRFWRGEAGAGTDGENSHHHFWDPCRSRKSQGRLCE